MLKKINIRSIRLLTNNPQKIKDLESFGIVVEKRIPIEIPPNGFNESYLKTKKEKFGHILSLK